MAGISVSIFGLHRGAHGPAHGRRPDAQSWSRLHLTLSWGVPWPRHEQDVYLQLYSFSTIPSGRDIHRRVREASQSRGSEIPTGGGEEHKEVTEEGRKTDHETNFLPLRFALLLTEQTDLLPDSQMSARQTPALCEAREPGVGVGKHPAEG